MPPKRSTVFDHYDVPSDISGSFIAKCKHCTREMKGSAKATSNLLNHIKRHHPSVNLNHSPATSTQRHDGCKLQHNNHQTLVLESLAHDESFMDLTLTSQGRVIKAHKSVLSAMSPYFRRVLSNNPCQHPIIVMPRDIRFDELKNLITYIYKGEVTVPFQEVWSLLKTAQMLEIKGLNDLDNESVKNMETPLKEQQSLEGTGNASRGPSVGPGRTMQERETSTSTPSKSQEENEDVNLIFVKEEMLVGYEEPPPDDPPTDPVPSMSSRLRKTSPGNEERATKRLRVSPTSSRPLSPYPPANVKDNILPFEGRTPSNIQDTFANFIADPSSQTEPFGCSFCTRSFQSLESLRFHLSLKHPLYDPFICDCGVVFFQQHLLDSHKSECCNRHSAK